eukprot:1084607-Rhodomonas_salina.3
MAPYATSVPDVAYHARRVIPILLAVPFTTCTAHRIASAQSIRQSQYRTPPAVISVPHVSTIQCWPRRLIH